MLRRLFILALIVGQLAADVPPETVIASHAMVVAGHPEAAEAGLAVLRAGGNAVDAAVAVSLSLGVAEPFGSGLGGKLMLLYYDARSRRVHVIEAMDAASTTLQVAAFLARPEPERTEGGASVAVPGLPDGLWRAHQRWGVRPWTEDVAPARALAEHGAFVLPKTAELIAASSARIADNPEAARLYLPQGRPPIVGSRLPNADLARTLARYSAEGPGAIYRGAIAEALVATVQRAGGFLTAADLAAYRAHDAKPIVVPFYGGQLYSSSSPTGGGVTLLAALATLRDAPWTPGRLRNAANLDRLGRTFQTVSAAVNEIIGDANAAEQDISRLFSPSSIEALRRRAAAPGPITRSLALVEAGAASTTHFIVVDAKRNIVCATQSLSFHFGCGLVAPGTGILLNNSLSNFSVRDPLHRNFPAPGRRPRSTIAPTLWLGADLRPRLALGLPGGQRIPTALLQILIDYAAFERPLADAIGDIRLHFVNGDQGSVLEYEAGLPPEESESLGQRGWATAEIEPAGTGIHFGGVSAVEFLPDGTLRGHADRRRTNAARGQ